MTREVLEAHARGDVRAAILESADYYGPGVTMSRFSARTFPLMLAGLFIPAAREGVEMRYQLTEPFVVSSEAIETAFGLAPTPLAEGLRRTIEWWKKQEPVDRRA
jgi:hypothetical protein